ncbi:Rx, N-terminal [Dillenia turbinata]|uniref:Rx, N-terminal n=1 Tax=Dillenia turbinata TaxID=194707 RepID=A0AAN8ZQW7_9MAGN
MAESLAKSLVSNLLGRITDLLINEVKFLSNVADQVNTIQDEVQWVQTFLKDADAVRQKEGDERLQTWVSQLRDIAYDAEDAIDTYILRVASIRNQEGVQGFLKRSTLFIHVSKHTHHVGIEIEAINKRISKIRERLPTYGMQNLAAFSSDNRQHKHRRRHYAHEKEEDAVGLEEDINKLVVELTNKDGRARLVSLVGIGGSGKTTLARKLYNHVQIKKHFNCNIWVSISQEWHARDVLLSILTQSSSLTKEERELVEKMTNDELVIKVRNFLKEKMFLVVLDDIWVKEAWDELSPVFPRGNAGSKLIFTTRIKDVPLYADPHCLVHESRSLTNEEAWELLLKKVKRDLEDGSREEASAFSVLSLLGYVSEDYEIRVKPLIRMWIAEGFMSSFQIGRGETLEDVGEECLQELIQRSMIQVEAKDTTGRVKSCRVHHLIRNLCLEKAQEENFLEILLGAFSWSRGILTSDLFYILVQNYPFQSHNGRPRAQTSLSLGCYIFKEFTCLMIGNKFPYSVGGKVVQKMKHLRYVRLYFVESNSKDFRVGSLKSLQCLAMVKAGDWMSRDLPHLTNLKKLVIDEIETQEQVKAVLGSPCITMDRLHTLSLGIPESSYEEYPSLEQHSFCQNLSKLYLKGKMTKKKLQLQQQLPPNLTKLTLKYSMLKEQDPNGLLHRLEAYQKLKQRLRKVNRTESEATAKPDQGADFDKIQHIPTLKGIPRTLE